MPGQWWEHPTALFWVSPQLGYLKHSSKPFRPPVGCVWGALTMPPGSVSQSAQPPFLYKRAPPPNSRPALTVPTRWSRALFEARQSFINRDGRPWALRLLVAVMTPAPRSRVSRKALSKNVPSFVFNKFQGAYSFRFLLATGNYNGKI